MSSLDSAEIFEALGDYGRAAMLRWGADRPTPPDYLRALDDELAEVRCELEHAIAENVRLEALLCARCQRKSRGGQ